MLIKSLANEEPEILAETGSSRTHTHTLTHTDEHETFLFMFKPRANCVQWCQISKLYIGTGIRWDVTKSEFYSLQMGVVALYSTVALRFNTHRTKRLCWLLKERMTSGLRAKTVGSGEKWSCVPDHKVKCNIFVWQIGRKLLKKNWSFLTLLWPWRCLDQFQNLICCLPWSFHKNPYKHPATCFSDIVLISNIEQTH